jgi:hypothetical protein
MGMEMKKLSGMAMLLWMWIENEECRKVMWEGEEQDVIPPSAGGADAIFGPTALYNKTMRWTGSGGGGGVGWPTMLIGSAPPQMLLIRVNKRRRGEKSGGGGGE